MARATCQWLDEQGQLWPFYRAWRDARADAGDPDGADTFRRIHGQSLAEADPDWRAWVLRRTP